MKRIMKSQIRIKNQHQNIINERLILQITQSPFIVNLQYAFQNKKAIYYVSNYKKKLLNKKWILQKEENYFIY